MVKIIPVNTKAQKKQFVEFQYDHYRDCPQFVPPFKADIYTTMDPKKHPYYDHSIADFYLAEKDGKIVGRIAALENKPFNVFHKTKDAEFYFYETINDVEVSTALLDTVTAWAKARGLNRLVGPKGFSALDGYGILVEGYEHRQMMNMMNYHYPYYKDLVEGYGFTKAVDFVSSYVVPAEFVLPEKVVKAAEIARKRGRFEVISFKSKGELKKWAPAIGQAYNKAFVNNWEYYPLTPREIDYVVKNALTVILPQLFKLITKDGEVVGFTLPFPDVSRAMQANKGKLGPIEIVRLLWEIQHTDWVDFNGIGILPEHQGFGGNAILYSALTESMRHSPHFKHAELTQVAETAVQMRKDLANLGVKPYKNHRVYQKDI